MTDSRIPAFAPDLEDCGCASCNAIAATNFGARQLRARIVLLDQSDTPAAATAGASTPSNQPENVHAV